jgi:predicted lipoprotein with Yx(FWY)xxD motif
MKVKLLTTLCLYCYIHTSLQAQQSTFNQNSSRSNHDRSYNQNSARSNHTRMSDAWDFGVNTGGSFGVNSNENTLFRGNSIATKMFSKYYFGNWGLGLSGGIIPGTISSSAISKFLVDRKFPADATITNAKPVNSYLLFGPSVRFGHRVQFGAEVNGGMFYNNPGGVVIGQQGAVRPLYRFDNGSKNLFPGFSGNLLIAYPIDHSTRFFINTDYLQTKSSIRLFDPQRGIDVATEQNRDVKLFTVGVGITKSFNTRRVLPTVNKKEIAIDEGGVHMHEVKSPRDLSTGQASGRVLPTVNKREIVSPRDIATGQASGRMMNESCGPVTIKTNNADGTTSEMTFACPADAIDYQSRISMNVTVPKQTQGATFGEKVNQGLHAAGSALANGASREGIIHRDIAARNILVGRVQWSGNSEEATGIVTNKSAAVSSVSNLGGGGSGAAAASYARNGVATGAGATAGAATIVKGIVTNIYTREAGSGMATGKRSRDAASGMATGRRQYEPVFFEEEAAKHKGQMNDVQSNPMYVDKAMAGTNPLYDSNKRVATGDVDGDGVPELTVHLIDADNGATVATTQTEEEGTFFFANIPSGNYIVKVKGAVTAKKGYDYYQSKSMDVAGEILAGNDFWSINLIADTGTVETALAVIKTKTKSNQSNDRTGSSLVWSPRSNRIMNVAVGDLDGDGLSEIIVGNKISDLEMSGIVGGALPGGAVISSALRPGSPIGGLSIKGGKNPGGNLRTIQTNEYGEFEFTDLGPGNYTFTAELNYYINDETFISLGNDAAQNIVTSESNLKGSPVKITATQNSQSLKSGINGINSNQMPNRISMNVTVPKQTQGTTFGERKAQNNNTVRSNRTDNAVIVADLDGDGTMESSYLNINGEIATINITEPGVQVTEGDNAAGGINITEPGIRKSQGIKQTLQTQVMRTNPTTGPVKWMAPEATASKVWGDPHVDEKDGSLRLSNGTTLEQQKWKCQDIALKAIRCGDGVIVAATANGEDYPDVSKISLSGLANAQPVIKAAVWFAGDNGKTYKKETDATGRLSLNGLPPGVPLRMIMNMGVDSSDDILITFTTDAQGNTISNVLKTKHDTAKNAIGNIR